MTKTSAGRSALDRASQHYGFRNYADAKKRAGATMLEKIILLAIALFVLAFILPPALTAIATSALTSVNSAVITLFQILVPIIAVIGVVLMIYHSTGSGE